MAITAARAARMLRAFVDHPLTLPFKGLVLMKIGLGVVWGTIQHDVMHGRVRHGHEILRVGPFHMLDALPRRIRSLDSGERYPDAPPRAEEAERP